MLLPCAFFQGVRLRINGSAAFLWHIFKPRAIGFGQGAGAVPKMGVKR